MVKILMSFSSGPWWLEAIHPGTDRKIQFTISTDKQDAGNFGKKEAEKILRILSESNVQAEIVR